MPKLVPLAAPVLALALLGVACSSSSDGATTTTTGGGNPAKGCETGLLPDQPLLTPSTATGPQSASYSNDAVAAQSRDCEGMRSFISTPQPGFDLQSYVFYGHLKASDGTIIPFSTMTQSEAADLGNPSSPVLRVTATTVNTGDGIVIGGVDGLPSSTLTESATSNPFSLRTQSSPNGPTPEYIDARVVEGQLGQPGALIQLTGQLTGEAASGATVPLQFDVRLRDVSGVGQWGYGPSGFFPQWLLPAQHDAVTGSYGGDVAAYLEATNEPLTDQGSYYYSSPVVDVESFTITEGGTVIASGAEGELLIDYVTQSFDASAANVVENGIQWTEFSTLLDGGRSLKVGETQQASVGTLPYAMELRSDGKRLANGALEPSQRWDIGDITITPDTTKTWTSPRSGKTYVMRYTAELKGTDGTGSASFTYEAVIEDQEVDAGGRTVYEGLYRVTGTLDGATVTGYAWAEIQPSGGV